jgi:RNA polymerase sigma-70 factor (ECF subfamily)
VAKPSKAVGTEDRHTGHIRLVSRPRALDDSELARRLYEGDPAAPALLFDRHAAHVERVLRRVLGSIEHADLVSEVFLRAIDRADRLEHLEEDNALVRWLTRIAVFTARERLRSERRRRWLVPFSSLPPRTGVAEIEGGGAAPSPLEELEARETLRRLFALLDKFPVDERLPFTLRYLQDMELADVAEACSVSLATCKRRLARADARFVSMAQRDPSLARWLESGTRWAEK